MTVEATKPAETAEDRLRSRALDAIRTCVLEVILAADEPLRTVDVGRLAAERLGLELTEEELGGMSTVARMVLDSDPLFSQSNRQWDLALRMGRAEGDRRKPVERAIEDFTDLLGHPTMARPVAVLVAAVYGREPEYYERMFERLAPTRPGQFLQVRDGRFGITRWLIEIDSDEPDEVEDDNFQDRSLLEPVRQAAEKAQGDTALEFAIDVVRRAGAPVDNRALLFFAWRRFPETEPVDLFVDLFASPELALERGPSWVTDEEEQRVLATIQSLCANPDSATDLVAASAPSDDEEIGILAPTTVRVSDDDLQQVYEYMQQNERTFRVSELCQQALEAFPGSRTYPGVLASLTSRMTEDPRFQWLGYERFRLRGNTPPEVELLPEGLAFDDAEYLGEEGAEVDRVLGPEDWKFALDEQIEHYLVQDVGDDATQPGAAPDRVLASPPLHHYVAGTRYLRHADRGFFPVEPDVVQVTMVAPDGSRFEAWVNNRLGLLFGLKEWYDANLPWVGGQFAIEHGASPDEYVLVYGGEVEPLMDISMERLQQLLQLRAEAATDGLPLSEVVLRIIKAYSEGIHFVTLFTEVNVVRRIRRAQLASALSGQRYFQQNTQQPGIWIYDEKRAQKSKKKGGPKRPMREYYDEDEDVDLFEE